MVKKKPEIHKEITILLAPETPDERGQKPASLLKRISGKLAPKPPKKMVEEFKRHPGGQFTFPINFSEEQIARMEELKKEGYTINFALPKDGIPIYTEKNLLKKKKN
jgi:hypothetical protein